MAIFGAVMLVVVLLMRPMEVSPFLAKAHLLETLTALTAIGIVTEAVSRKSRLGVAPQFPWLVGFIIWAFFTTAARLGSQGFSVAWASIGLGAIFMTLVSLATITIARLRALVIALVATLGVICCVAVHQGMQPRTCIEAVYTTDDPEYFPDGRECESPRKCEEGGKDGSDYICERLGLFETFSIEGRVRYRGQLEDPNELAVFVGAGLPFVFFLGRGRSRTTQILLLAPIVIVSLWAVVLSQSRTGQMVIGTVLMIPLLKKYGLRGAIVAAAAVFPLMLFGGREGADAESSSLERATILYEGIDLFRAHPFIGVGIGQFREEISIPMTAHNSYLLSAAEMGYFGLVVWAGMLWTSIKTAIVVATDPPPGIDPELVRFAGALAISLPAIFVGIFFLSFCYKQLLFVWLGLAAALHGAVKLQAPLFQVKTTSRDWMGLAAFSAVILTLIFVISRVKGTG